MEAALQQDLIVDQLKEMLERAKEQQLDVTPEQAVYDNPISTNEDLQAALKSVRTKLHLITFSDAKTQSICLDNWDADQDGELTFEEAAAVTDIGELFRGATTMKYFEELQYFTSLTEIPENAFRSASNLQVLYLPKSVKKIGSMAFMSCSLLRNLVILNDADMLDYGTCYLVSSATVFVPQNMVSSYQADDNWSKKVKNVTEYTGKPVVTATATRIYGRTVASIETLVLGAPVLGEPVTSCDLIKVATTPVGTYPINVERGTIITPDAELREGVLTITPASLTITANSCSRNVGEANPEFEITYKGWRNKETADVLIHQPVVTCEATPESPAGEYDIVVSGAEAQNYEITYVNGKLTVIDPLGIDSLKADPTDAQPLYDMQGRKVTQPKRGIYVSGKRKVIVK